MVVVLCEVSSDSEDVLTYLETFRHTDSPLSQIDR